MMSLAPNEEGKPTEVATVVLPTQQTEPSAEATVVAPEPEPTVVAPEVIQPTEAAVPTIPPPAEPATQEPPAPELPTQELPAPSDSDVAVPTDAPTAVVSDAVGGGAPPNTFVHDFQRAQGCFQNSPFGEAFRDKLTLVSPVEIRIESPTARPGAYREDPTKAVVCDLEGRPDAELTVEVRKPVEKIITE